MTRPHLPRLLVCAIGSLTLAASVGNTAHGRVSIPLSNAFGGPVWSGVTDISTPSDALDDIFTYNPDLNYTNYASIPNDFLPRTAWNGGDTLFIGAANDASNYWGADVSLGAGQTLDFIDLWGRSDYAGAEQTRHQSLVISFYNAPGGAAGGGTVLGTSPEYSGVTPKAANNANGSAYGRFDVTSLLNATQRGQVQSFEISHGPTQLNDYLLLTEVRAGTGTAAPALPVLTINRATGAASLFNGPAAPLNFIEYSITSNSGALKPGSWMSIAATGDGDSGGSIDTDIWGVLSEEGSKTELSEGAQSGDGVSLSQGQTINLGAIWTRSPYEDIGVQFVAPDFTNAPVLVEFTGNSGVPFKVGDLNFDGAVGPADWPILRNKLGSIFTNVSVAESYGSGDLDGDLDVDITDFRAFEKAYDGVNGTGSFAAMAAGVPEPGSLALVALGGMTLFAAPRRRRKLLAQVACVVVLLTAVAATDAKAQTFTVIPNPTGPVTATSEFSAAFPASALFDDATLTAADIGVKLFNGATGQYAGVGAGPFGVFIDNGSSITTNWLGYAQRIGGIINADRVGQIEVWFSDTDFGGALPATPPQATVAIDDPASNIFNAYPLLTTLSGRYAALQLTISDYSAPVSASNIGGHEFRFLTGPAPLTLQVNTVTGALTVKNSTGGSAQAVSLDGYQITSAAGSLATTWTGLGGLPGFPEGNGTGNGWEAGGGSNANILTEAYLLGGSAVATGASLNLGVGYNTSLNSQDLKFRYSYDNSVYSEGLVQYVNTAGPAADFDADGDVDGGDFLRWQRNLGVNAGATKAQGDADGNGAVNAADLALWKSGFANSIAAAGVVPEPASASLLVAGVLVAMAANRRKRARA